MYSAVFLNIALLETHDVYYNHRLHCWEDLDFNRRVNQADLVICKCYR